MKARQVGSEIKGYDLRSASEDPSMLDAAFLKVSILVFLQKENISAFFCREEKKSAIGKCIYEL